MAFKLFLLIFCTKAVFACSLNQEIISLSGPVTSLLDNLNLLNDKKLVAISKLNSVSKKNNVEEISGGIFTSKKYFNKNKNTVFFIDSSFELIKTIKRSRLKKYVEFKSRNLDPFDVTRDAMKLIQPYLSGCNDEMTRLKKYLKRIKSMNFKFRSGIIFLLGEVSHNKLPKLVISYDGFVKFLRKNSYLKTYDSDLAYVSWSQKLISDYTSKNYKLIGINDSNSHVPSFKKIDEHKYNIFFKGALIPGLNQVKLLEFIGSKVL